jgi:hypothetical protein
MCHPNPDPGETMRIAAPLLCIDGRTGGLTPTGEIWSVGSPVCTVFSNVK